MVEAGRSWAALAGVLIAFGGVGLSLGDRDAGPSSGVPDEVRYRITFDRSSAADREIRVEMSFRVDDAGPVVLSVPAWTPGSYELDNFARFIRDFSAMSGGRSIRWDKADFDSWRVHPSGPGRITVSFVYAADTLDVGMAASRDDFAFFNGTNLFPYPEVADLGFPATVEIRTEPGWRVATGMRPGDRRGEYTADNYHDLVDMPFFVGRFDLDSARIDDRWYRLATYPEGALDGDDRERLWEDVRRMVPPMAEVFGDTPWRDYTILAMFESGIPFGAALEHQNSHLGIYASGFIGSVSLSSIIAHEIFHAWNVKRLRPQDLWPYAYDRPQPTPFLWVSEGITDYYADLALVRGGIVSPEGFYRATTGKIQEVSAAPAFALEDASVSTWIEPVDGTALLYYEKGSLAGLMLDILIRDSSGNRASLDDVMRSLYRSEYEAGSGFSEEEWWGAVRTAAGDGSFEEFRSRFVDGREPYPWDEVLPLAGLRLQRETRRVPFIDLDIELDSLGIRISGVAPGSPAEASGFLEGDYIERIGDVEFDGVRAAARFRARYADAPEGTEVQVRVRRGDEVLDVPTDLEFTTAESYRVQEDDGAAPSALRIREGILTGRADR